MRAINKEALLALGCGWVASALAMAIGRKSGSGRKASGKARMGGAFPGFRRTARRARCCSIEILPLQTAWIPP